MRSRARLRNSQINQNLDSFLDVLTNTVGVLMFISLFVTLIATGGSTKSKITIQTPLSTSTDKEPLLFEINGNKISHIDLRQIRDQELELLGNLPNCNEPSNSFNSADYAIRQQNYQACQLSRSGRQTNFRASTKNYNVKTINGGDGLLFEPISENIGETIAQLAAADSQFQQLLSQHDPDQDYLGFYVRVGTSQSNSFEAFREVRKKAWAKGYQVGWIPHRQDVPLIIPGLLSSERSEERSFGVQ